MKAVVFHGTEKVRVDTVPDPKIEDPKDVIVKITLTAICGSDLHLYDGYNPTMKEGDILGHEFMGEVVEVGKEVKKLKQGDRIVVPFDIACGYCFFCKNQLFSLCDNTNPNKEMMEKLYGMSGAGLFGYSHLYGGYCGGQAEYVRVPFADVNHIKIPNHLSDEKVLFISDIFPTGYMAAENCNIKGGETVAVWGAGPVGQMTIKSLFMLGAKRVIAIDQVPERLDMAKSAGAEIMNFAEEDHLIQKIKDVTNGMGPDAVVDAVGMEADSHGFAGLYDKAKQAVRLQTDRPTALREVIQACRKGGYVSIPGVYSGVIDTFNIGVAFAKGLTFKMGQTHVQKYMHTLLNKITNDEIDPSFVITHQLPLDEAPHAYKIFRDKEDKCIKVVMKP